MTAILPGRPPARPRDWLQHAQRRAEFRFATAEVLDDPPASPFLQREHLTAYVYHGA